MPIYEYLCDKEEGGCGERVEEIQKFSDKPLKKCPKCSKNVLRRLFGNPNFMFVGTGFYETDYKRKKD